MKKFLVSGLIILIVGAAGLVWYEMAMDDARELPETPARGAAFFESPRQAVDAISKMQGEEDWAGLARYYDLEGSDIDRETLVSGEFFIRTERPELAHPGGFWRYKHPFAPSFEYDFTMQTDVAGIVVVRVAINIDQGSDSPLQQGWQEFLMRESDAGFQVMPGSAGQIGRTPPAAVIPQKF